MTEPLPLFPLHTVLVPGAAMGLRVFEPRYLDLVRECSRAGSGFGISLLLDGQETGTGAVPAAYGTEARIEDFGTGADGLLTLRVRGMRRYHAGHVRVRDNGLQVADVDWCADVGGARLRPEHALLATVLERVLDHVGGTDPVHAQGLFEDAAWVGWRLAELLPLELPQRQALLQVDDPHARLDCLMALMP